MAPPLEQVLRDLNATQFVIHKLGETFDNFQVQSSSILNLAEQWRNLKASFGNISKSMESRVKEVELKERENCIVANKLHSFQNEVESKRKHLKLGEQSLSEKIAKVELRQNEVKKWLEVIEVQKRGISERTKAIEEKESELDEGLERVKKVYEEETRVTKVAEELESRQKQLDKRCKGVELRESRVDERCKEFELRESGIDERCKTVELRENQVDERGKELDSREKGVKEREEVLGVSETRLNEDQKTLKLREQEMDDLYRLLESRENEINEHLKEVGLKEKEISERYKETDIIGKQLNMLKEVLDLREKELEESSKALESKVKEVDGCCQMVEKKAKQLNELSEELELKEKQLNELSKELELKEKQLSEVSCTQELQTKQMNNLSESVASIHKQFYEFSQERKLEKKQMDGHSVCDNDKVFALKEKDILELKGKQMEDPALNPKSQQTSNQKNILASKEGSEVDIVHKPRDKQTAALHQVADVKESQVKGPKRAHFHGFFATHLSKAGVAFEASVVRNTCLLLLEHLRDLKPEISKYVKKAAMKVANKWEAKLKVQGETEVTALAFLLLLATYKLAASVNQDYLKKLCGMIDKHRLAPRLRQRLDELNRTNVTSGFEVEAVQLDVMEEASALDSFSVKTSSDIRSLCKSMNVNGLRSYLIEHVKDFDVLHDKILDALRHASDPAKLVLDVCQIAVLDCDMSHADVNNTAWILLLDLLMKFSPSISIEVTIEAKHIAAFVRTRLEGSCKPVDYYKFLQFVASYKLANFFDCLVYRPEECVDLCFALGLAEKIPGVIKSLIDQQNVIRAVKYICVFAEEHTFPPVPILEAHLENVKKKVDGMIREKAERFEAKMLRQTVSCISTCKLESKLSPDPIIARIKELEKKKGEWVKISLRNAVQVPVLNCQRNVLN